MAQQARGDKRHVARQSRTARRARAAASAASRPPSGPHPDNAIRAPAVRSDQTAPAASLASHEHHVVGDLRQRPRAGGRGSCGRRRRARSCRGRRSGSPGRRRELPRSPWRVDLILRPDVREEGIGRVLVASLHQGIADILPTRLGFYENWLNAEGLRDGTIGLAPLYAVLSFLRQEGDAYHIITSRAGEYAAEWTVESMPPFQRAIIRGVPGVAARPAPAATCPSARAQQLSGQPRGRRASGAARRGSTCARRFSARCASRSVTRCAASTPRRSPGLLTLFNLRTRAEVLACRGTGEPACVMTMAAGQRRRAKPGATA